MKNTLKPATKNSRKKAQETQKTNWFFPLLLLFFLPTLRSILCVVGCLFVVNNALAYSGGDGSRANPYQIADVNNLLQLAADANDYRKFFILTADINLAGYDFNNAVISPYTYNSYSHEFEGAAFYGSFDGACHKISNLTINAGENAYYLGLFGQTAFDAIDINSEGEYYWSEIKNLTLENVNINSNLDGGTIGNLIGYNYGVPLTNCHSNGNITFDEEYTYDSTGGCHGGLVGANSGNITNCSSEGNISITSYLYPHGTMYAGGLVGASYDSSVTDSHSDCNITCYGYNTWDYGGFVWVGGLVGENSGEYNNSFINKCYSTGIVSANIPGCFTIMIGGLAGGNYEEYYQTSISKCFSTSPVTVTITSGDGGGSHRIGGVVGTNTAEVNDCYSTGPVTGLGSIGYYDPVGGLVGYNAGALATIRNCYSVGEVNAMGSGYVGGLVGAQYDESSSIINSYFLATSEPANGLGEPLSDAQMRHQASFVGWDFVGETINGTEDIWWLLENITYPKLNWQRKLPSNPCVPGGPGPGDGGIYFPDYNADNFINFTDFAIFANAWMTVNPSISLDGDNDVDINDLKIFCDYWLTYTNNIGY
jgi:hypothetical protein